MDAVDAVLAVDAVDAIKVVEIITRLVFFQILSLNHKRLAIVGHSLFSLKAIILLDNTVFYL